MIPKHCVVECLFQYRGWENLLLESHQTFCAKSIFVFFNKNSLTALYDWCALDTNLVENYIRRSFVIGRKNWLFSGCLQGSYCKCRFFYSLIQNARISGIESLRIFTGSFWILGKAARGLSYENLPKSGRTLGSLANLRYFKQINESEITYPISLKKTSRRRGDTTNIVGCSLSIPRSKSRLKVNSPSTGR